MAPLRRTLRAALLASGAGAARDARLLRGRLGSHGSGSHHVLVGPPGGGNIGDQAMVESFLERTTGPVILVTSGAGTLSVPAAHEERVEVQTLPGLLYHSGRSHREALLAFADTLREAESLSIVGADIMDGGYVARASVARATIARAAAQEGIDTRVLGFSWPGRPLPAARRALRAAARAGVALLPRDPVSAMRLRDDGIPVVREVADVVFSATTIDDTLCRELGLDMPYAVVNISGHIARSADLVAEYHLVVRALREQGLEVVLLPHVVTSSADDRVPSKRLYESLADTAVRLVSRVPSPAEVRGLARGASVTVAGRMHLAIMTLMSGVPAVTLATQGKVEGLMKLMGCPELCVEPAAGCGARIVAVAAEVLPRDSRVRASIADALPHVRALSSGNFTGLEAAVAAEGVSA